MSQYKVSVIIPVYNAARYLSETLDSVLAQTLSDIEILCVDDGSTDESVSIIKEYQKKDSRIKLFFQKEESKGAALARNLGVANAKGEYLSILDADDLFEKDMLESAYHRAVQTKADVVLYDSIIYDTETKMDVYYTAWRIASRFPEGCFAPESHADDLFLKAAGAAWTGIFRRAFIEEHNISFYSVHVTDDIEFVYVALASAERIAVVPKIFVHYRRDASGNQSSNLGNYPETGWLAFSHFKKSLEQRGLYERYKIAYVNRMMGAVCDVYLKSMTEVKSFKKLFGELKKRLPEMGAFDIADEDFVNVNLPSKRNRIIRCTPEEYLLGEICIDTTDYRSAPFLCTGRELSTKECIDMILYGAGVWGKSVFRNVLGDSKFKLLHWVDQNFAELGYPIESPEVIKESVYDMIFIAIQDKKICQEVKKYLIAMGIEADKIVYNTTM